MSARAMPEASLDASRLLEVRDLGVDFTTPQGTVPAVANVSLEVRAGECLAIVGESGCGKTQLLLACLGLLAANGAARGSVRFADHELIGASETALNAVRGTGIALLSQDPLSSLTPHLRIETLLTEGLLDRGLASRDEARRRALRALEDVGIPDPDRAAAPVPARAFGRYAPARRPGRRHDVRPALAVRGRTHHGP